MYCTVLFHVVLNKIWFCCFVYFLLGCYMLIMNNVGVEQDHSLSVSLMMDRSGI